MSRVEYIEIDLPVCPLTFGVAPCTATGTVCYNSLRTCGDRTAYFAERSGEIDTLRLTIPTLDANTDIIAIPSIDSVSYTPSRIDLGRSIGARSVLTVTVKDHPAPDTGPGGDPYRDTRGGDPFNTGSFWGKLRARWPWLRGVELRWYTGTETDSLDGMETRTYVIDKVDGPSSGGTVRITAKDPLTLTDDKRAQAPRLSRGVLANDFNIGDAAFAVTPSGSGNADYPASGFVAIGGEEIVEFMRAGDIFTVVGRGQFGTTAIDHSAGDRVQWCLRYTGTTAADVIYDLMVTYGNVPASFINKDNWDDELSEFAQFNFAAVITEPTPVVTLINEVLEQAGVSIWWDELAATVRFQVLRQTTGAVVYNDDFMLAGSFAQIDQPDKRVSEVWIYYDQISPLQNLDERTNYRIARLRTSTESFENHGTASVRQIFSRWMPAAAGTAVERLQEFILARFAEPPKAFSFQLLRDPDLPAPNLGQAVRVQSFFNQDAHGIPKISVCQIIQLQATSASWQVLAEEILTSDVDVPPLIAGVYIVPIDVSRTDGVNLRTEFLSWYAIEPDPGDTVVCIVRGGVVLGQTRADLPAFRTGTGWAAGVDIQLIVSPGAFIVGRGGDGGNVIRKQFFSGGSGTRPGGPAVWAEHDLDVVNNGVIGGGGGGGGGSAALVYQFFNIFFSERYISIACSGGAGAGNLAGAANATSVDSATISQGINGVGGSLEIGGAAFATSGATGDKAGAVAGGAGGNLGQPGGNASASASSGTPADTVRFDSQVGGAAGAAIVESGGTVTYTTRGDIRGAAPA
jgi:hypothetical protein